MSTPTQEPQFLRELVTSDDVAKLLVGRSPRLLNDPNRRAEIQGMIDGRAAEVARIVGDPPPVEILALSMWAVALGTAALVEDSYFPEQQNGDDGRAERYRSMYADVLQQLRSDPAAGGTTTSVAGARGTFPPALPWPEPAVPYFYPVGYPGQIGWYRP